LAGRWSTVWLARLPSFATLSRTALPKSCASTMWRPRRTPCCCSKRSRKWKARMLIRLTQLYESLGTRDLVQIAILALVLFGVLRFMGKTFGRGSSIGRGLGLVVVGLFLLIQVVIACLDLTELGA